jgi:hypothetical protein
MGIATLRSLVLRAAGDNGDHRRSNQSLRPSPLEPLEGRVLMSAEVGVTGAAFPAGPLAPSYEAPAARVTGPDLAHGRPAVASSVRRRRHGPARATDGNAATHWASAREEGGRSWLYVDLGDTYALDRVNLDWGRARPGRVTVQVADVLPADSADESNWRDAAPVVTGNRAKHDLSVSGVGRYVRVVCEASTRGGRFALGDVRVFGAAAPAPDATVTESAAQAISAPVVSGPLLPVMPTSDAWYGAVVNASQYVTGYTYPDYLPPDVKLMTDLTGNSQAEYTTSLATMQAQYPDMLIGTYHSFRDAQLAATMTNYPRRAVPREGLNASQILMKEPGNPDADIVNYSNTSARKYLVKNVVQDVTNTGRPLAYLDNVSHNENGFPIAWSTTTAVIKEMATNLHAANKRVIVNAAWTPGVTSTTSVDQLINSGIDGVSLEMGFHANVRNNVGRIQTAMAQYRRMLDTGMTVIFIAVGNATGDAATIENTEIEQRLQAAFGMMFRKPGDRLFTNQIFWRPVQEWTKWPEQFGAPVAPATVTTNDAGQIVMTRQFARTTLTVNVATKEVTYTPLT